MEQRRKQIKGKIIFKHQTASEWELSSYVPDEGERVLYDPDDSCNYVREKFGDGKRMVKDLPFAQWGGKSAYQYAKEGGYEGTEAQFSDDFASVLMGGGGTAPIYNGSVEVLG